MENQIENEMGATIQGLGFREMIRTIESHMENKFEMKAGGVIGYKGIYDYRI